MSEISTVSAKQRALAERLYLKTVADELTWEDYGGGYQCQIGTYIVRIFTREADFDQLDYWVVLSNWLDSEVDRFSDVELSGGMDEDRPVLGKFKNYYVLLKEMYDLVRRKVSGSEKAIDDLLDLLGD